MNGIRMMRQYYKQPPLPFSYHNWLIDPNYKWEDMSKPVRELVTPKELAAEFIKRL